MIEIIPSVLATTEAELAEIKKKLEFYSGALHIDIADGKFVPTLTVGPDLIEKYFSGSFHVHLMVQEPGHKILEWLSLSNVASIIFHIEAADKPEEMINTIHEAGKKAGVAINPETDLALLENAIRSADFVHFMTVHPGHYGAEFQEGVVQKIADFHARHPEVFISADGGINPEKAKELEAAGVSAAIVGSYIQNSADPEKAFKEFNNN